MKKLKGIIKKELDSEPVYNEKYLKAKIKSCNEKINANYHNNKIPKEVFQFICLLVILIDTVFKTGKNYYPEVFLEECKYVVKEKKKPKYITDHMEICIDDSDWRKLNDNSGEENSSEENYDEENFDEKKNIECERCKSKE